MASEREGGESIRSLIQGFNGMQRELGLLPVSSGQMPMGVQLNQPPPPPPVMHPSDMALQISQQQHAMMMQTMQAAQMTRYQAPPSSPPQGGGGMTWGGSFAQMNAAQFNPQVAAAMGGGGGGMPNPMYSTSPAFGMYRPGASGPGMPMGVNPPPIYNPFAAQLPAPMFSTQPQQNYQIMQAHQARTVGTMAGLGEAGFGLGGAMLGGALGSAFGPLGTFAGGMLGGMVGQGVGNMAMNPALMDIQRGRGIQNMTSSFMAGGASLNPFTGMGMERGAARQTATGLRQMSQGYDFQRTGFNTEDVMKLTQLAGDQGMLQTAQNPEDIVNKMKAISKSISALVKITGDPDVKNAMAHLGQMRQLGFEGLQGQTAAVANRARFAQMAGVSQGAMHDQYGMPGAFMAQNMGLAGATGYTAGMMGGAAANMAVSSRSFTDVQLALSGGKQGVGQTAAMAALGAINQDVFATAALRRGKDGNFTLDKDAYVAASDESKSLAEVADLSAQSLGRLTDEERTSYLREAPEMKAKLAEQLGPQRLLLNAARQASALMKNVPNIGLGGALESMTGGNKQASRTLQLMLENPDYWDTQIQQERVTQREGASRSRAALGEYTNPGLLANIGRGSRRALSGLSEGLSSPFAAFAERGQRIDEDIDATRNNTFLTRRTDSQLIRTDAERNEAAAALESEAFSGVGGGRSLMQEGGLSRWGNRFGAGFGQSALGSAGRMARVGNEIEGGFLAGATNLGDAEAAQAAANSAGNVARAAARGTGFTNEQAADAMRNLQTQLGKGAGETDEFIRAVQKDLQSKKGSGWGGLKRAGGIIEADVEKSMREVGEKYGITTKADTSKITEMVARRAAEEGELEPYAKSSIASMDAAGIKATDTKEAVFKRADEIEERLGIEQSNYEKDKEAVRALANAHTPAAMALAAGAMQGDEDAKAKIRASVRESMKGTPGAYEKASTEAGEIRKGLKDSIAVRRLLTGAIEKGGGAEKALDTFGLLRTEVKARAGAVSREETLLGLESDTGEAGLTGTTREIAERLTTKMVEDEGTGEKVKAYTKIKDPTLRAAFDKFARADDKDAAAKELSPFLIREGKEKVAVHGAETRSSQSLIAELEEGKKKYAKGGRSTREHSDNTFATSVELFHAATMALVKATDKNLADGAVLPSENPPWFSWGPAKPKGG